MYTLIVGTISELLWVLLVNYCVWQVIFLAEFRNLLFSDCVKKQIIAGTYVGGYSTPHLLNWPN